MKPVTFYVEGNPVAQPRARARKGGGGVYNPPGPINKYREKIREHAKSNFPEPHEGALSVSIEFYFARTKEEMGSKYPAYAIWRTKKPDADNLAKAVLDAMNGVAYVDDSQVCHLSIVKLTANKDGEAVTKVTISPMEVW